MTSLAYRPERVSVTDRQLAQWNAIRRGTELELTGPCPKCQDQATVPVPMTASSLESASEAADSELTTELLCLCAEEHRGRPDGEHGCGRTWTVTAVVAGDGSVTLRVARDPRVRLAAETFRREQRSQLAAIRTAADRWTAGIAALFAAIGLVLPVLSRETIHALSPGFRLATGAALTTALVLASFAIVRGYQAGHGYPVTRTVGNDQALLNWYDQYLNRPHTAASYLRQAIGAALATVAALAVGTSLPLFGPAAPTAGPVKVTRTDASVVCGDLLTSGGSTLRVRRADSGNVQTVPTREVGRVQPVKQC